MDDSTTLFIFFSLLILGVAGYFAYQYFYTPSCADNIISYLSSLKPSKNTFTNLCTWLASITTKCSDDENITFTLQYTLKSGATKGLTKSIPYKRVGNTLVPQNGLPPFPSCSEDYPKMGLTMTFIVNGKSITKHFPPTPVF